MTVCTLSKQGCFRHENGPSCRHGVKHSSPLSKKTIVRAERCEICGIRLSEVDLLYISGLLVDCFYHSEVEAAGVGETYIHSLSYFSY